VEDPRWIDYECVLPDRLWLTVFSMGGMKLTQAANHQTGAVASPAKWTLLFILALSITGISNLLKDVIPGFWLGPILIAAPTAMWCSLRLHRVHKASGYQPITLAVLTFYVIMALLDVLILSNSSSGIAFRRTEFVIIFALIAPLYEVMNKRSIAQWVRSFTVVAVLFILLDYFYSPFSVFLDKYMEVEREGYFTTHRASGFFVNPNAAGATLAILALMCAQNTGTYRRVLYYSITLIGILATVSRGSLIMWALAVALNELVTTSSRKAVKINFWAIASISALSLVLVTISIAASSNSPVLDALGLSNDTASRLTTLQDNSADERLDLLRAAWKGFADSPLIGQGVGYDYEWSLLRPVHNIYMQMLLEHGVIGIMWFAVFIWSLSRINSVNRIHLPILIAVKGLFNHSLINEAVDAVILGLFCGGWGAIEARMPTASFMPRNRDKAPKKAYV